MIIAVPTETLPGETRVALVPAQVPVLAKAGHEVCLQQGAGTAAGYLDDAYADKGARIVADRAELLKGADAVFQVNALGANPDAGKADLGDFKDGQVVKDIMVREPVEVEAG